MRNFKQLERKFEQIEISIISSKTDKSNKVNLDLLLKFSKIEDQFGERINWKKRCYKFSVQRSL